MKNGKFICLTFCFFCILFLAGVILPSGSCYAERKSKGEWALHEGYPGDGFDGWGCIDRITDDEVVIDDTSMKLSRRVDYNLPDADYKPKRYFEKGILAGYIKNDNDEIESLWFIKKCSR